MKFICFDTHRHESLLPLTYTRPVAALRVGIATILEKWEMQLKGDGAYLTVPSLSCKYPFKAKGALLFINGALMPDARLMKALGGLKVGEGLFAGGELMAAKVLSDGIETTDDLLKAVTHNIEYTDTFTSLHRPYDLFVLNKEQIVTDFEKLTHGRASQTLSETVTLVGGHKNPDLLKRIFIEEGAEVECCYLNPADGPIYIGKQAKVSEGSMIRGPVAIGESSYISMGAKIYGGTTIGPHCKVGGEVSNSVFIGYSNKVHDGYLGDSVLGEWCNLGADTNTSNLKNDFAKIKLWDYTSGRFARTDLQFCGLIMGDFSRCAINTQFNSGTVVGVGANIYGSGFPRNFVPSFVIGGPQGYRVNTLKNVLGTGQIAMARRKVEMSKADELILNTVFEETKRFRLALK